MTTSNVCEACGGSAVVYDVSNQPGAKASALDAYSEAVCRYVIQDSISGKFCVDKDAIARYVQKQKDEYREWLAAAGSFPLSV